MSGEDSWNAPAEDSAVPPTASTPSKTDGPRAAVRFEEKTPLGEGAGGRVVLSVDHHLDRDVALKIVPADRPVALARLRREAAILVALEHPNIVPLYDLVERPDGGLQLALRVVRGRSLAREIQAGRAGDRAATLRNLRHLARAAEAVAFAHHRGFIHRDLKPANVMVGEFGETQVIDWGLAARLDDASEVHPSEATQIHGVEASFEPGLTVAGAVLGTPRYMSPEQARGERVDPRSDVWALGAMLYEIVARRPAFDEPDTELTLSRLRRGERPRPLREASPGVAGDLEAIAARAMDPDPERRYPDAAGFVEDLTAWLDGRPVKAHRYALLHRAGRFFRKSRATQIALPSFATAALAAGLVWSQTSGPTRVVTGAAATDAEERRREQALALVKESRGHLADDERPEAALTAARALALGPSPEARGILAATLDPEGLRLRDAVALSPRPCDAALLAPDSELWLCKRGGELLALTRDVELWQWRGPLSGVQFVDGGNSVALVHPRDGLVLLDALNGRPRGPPTPMECPGELAVSPGHSAAFVHRRECFEVFDGATLWPVGNGSPTQAAAVDDMGRWVALDNGGRLHWGFTSEVGARPMNAERFGGLREVHPSELGATVETVSTLVLIGDAVLVGTLRGELIRLDLSGRVLERMRFMAEVPVTALVASMAGEGPERLAVRFDRGGVALVDPVSLQTLARLPQAEVGAMSWTRSGELATLSSRLARWSLDRPTVMALRGLDDLLTIEPMPPATTTLGDGERPRVAAAHGPDISIFELSSGRAQAHTALPDVVKSLAIAPAGAEVFASHREGEHLVRLDRALAPGSDSAERLTLPLARRLGVTQGGALVALPYQPFLALGPPDGLAPFIHHGDEQHIDLAVVGDRVALLSREPAQVALVLELGESPAPTLSELARCEVSGALAIALDPSSVELYLAERGAVTRLDAGCGLLSVWPARAGGRELVPTDLSVSPDGHLVALGSREGFVLVWRWDGELLASVRAHGHRGARLAFDASGRWLHSAGWDGVIRSLWLGALEAPPAQVLAEVVARFGF